MGGTTGDRQTDPKEPHGQRARPGRIDGCPRHGGAHAYVRDECSCELVVGVGCVEAGSAQQAIDQGALPCHDDSQVRLWAASLGPRMFSAVQWTLDFSWETIRDITDVIPVARNSSTDAFYTTSPTLPSDLAGAYFCVDAAVGDACNAAVILFNQSFLDLLVTLEGSGVYTSSQVTTMLRSLACHETAHSFGLMHQVNNLTTESVRCVATGQFSDAVVGPHNVTHVNEMH